MKLARALRSASETQPNRERPPDPRAGRSPARSVRCGQDCYADRECGYGRHKCKIVRPGRCLVERVCDYSSD